MSATDPLAPYRAKRDFDATAEPAGKPGEGQGDAARFVVQEHHATRLHWDLRLERDGVLVSWAVPNGIPEDPKENRKAVHTEDHPLEYLDFEGDIPAGSYGGGQMRVWDRGTYDTEKWADGKLVVRFHGERLQGRYALFRAGSEKDWLIHRMDPPVDPSREPLPERLVPMLAKLGALPRDDEAWAYEIKWDGIRALAYSEPGRLRLESRNGKDITPRWPELRRLNRALSSHSAVLDGEIVAFDERGRPSFQRLQGRMHLSAESVIRRRSEEMPAVYVIFDLLFLDGHSLMDLPYEHRRERLDELGLEGPAWRVPAYHVGDGAALAEASRAEGLEGVIAKRLGTPYEPGRRNGAWLKIKNHRRQELVLAGWEPGEGRRRDRIGALLTGYYEPGPVEGEPVLRYAGKVGTGFDEAELDRLRRLLDEIARPTSPFTGRQPPRGARFAEPQYVAEVEFAEWTSDLVLRHPAYKGLREDRDPREVVLEHPEEEVVARSVAEAGWDPDAGAVVGLDAAVGVDDADADSLDADAAPHDSEADASVEGLAGLLATARPLAGGAVEVTAEGRTLRLTNLDKVLYPAVGFTKGQVIDYYARIAPVLLPHLRGRPLTLKRYPGGVDAGHFFEKQCPKHRPAWVPTAALWSRHRRAQIDFCLVEDLPTIVWTSNLADLELHPSLALAERIERPTVLAFDLDPGPPATIVDCCRVGLLLRGMFEQLALSSYAKTSGSKGLQVYVPINAEVTYDATKPFARAVAETLEASEPDLVISRMTKSLRPGKVLVDWSQNDEHKTTVCVYSLRAKDRPTVSTPVSWEEVEAASAAGDPEMLAFTSDEVLARVARHGDLFAPVLSQVQPLPAFA